MATGALEPMSQNLDFPIWSHSGQSGPLHHQITIQPKSAVPGSSWIVQVKVDAPSGWILKKGALTKNPSGSPWEGEGISRPAQGGAWTFQMEYQGELPPFGPGPQIETLWETPEGLVSILIDSGLVWTSTGENPEAPQTAKPFPLAASVLLGLIVLWMGVLFWMRRRPKFRIRRWAHQVLAGQPQAGSSWPVWETWLNNAAQSARSRLSDVPEAKVLMSRLDEARFGAPFNETWKRFLGKEFLGTGLNKDY